MSTVTLFKTQHVFVYIQKNATVNTEVLGLCCYWHHKHKANSPATSVI